MRTRSICLLAICWLSGCCMGGTPDVTGTLVGSPTAEGDAFTLHPTHCTVAGPALTLSDDDGATVTITVGGPWTAGAASTPVLTSIRPTSDAASTIDVTTANCPGLNGDLTQTDGSVAGAVHLACAGVEGYTLAGDLTITHCAPPAP